MLSKSTSGGGHEEDSETTQINALLGLPVTTPKTAKPGRLFGGRAFPSNRMQR
jgi:hypothetical protein